MRIHAHMLILCEMKRKENVEIDAYIAHLGLTIVLRWKSGAVLFLYLHLLFVRPTNSSATLQQRVGQNNNDNIGDVESYYRVHWQTNASTVGK